MQFQSNQSEKLIKNSNKTDVGGTKKNNWYMEYAKLHFLLNCGLFKYTEILFIGDIPKNGVTFKCSISFWKN